MDEPIEFTATTSLADLLASDAAEAARRPRKGRSRTWLFILGGIGIGIFAGASDTDKPTAMLKALFDPRLGLFTIVALTCVIVFVWASGRVTKLINKAFRRGTYADHRRHHPAVDRDDPALRMTRFYRFDETGMTTTTPYDEIWESWARITSLDETPSLLIVRVGGGLMSYPLSKAQLSDDLLGRLPPYIDARSKSKWPF